MVFSVILRTSHKFYFCKCKRNNTNTSLQGHKKTKAAKLRAATQPKGLFPLRTFLSLYPATIHSSVDISDMRSILFYAGLIVRNYQHSTVAIERGEKRI